VSSIPVNFGHLIVLQPLEEEVDDDVVKERLVVEQDVVLGVNGDGVAARRRELAVLLVRLDGKKMC